MSQSSLTPAQQARVDHAAEVLAETHGDDLAGLAFRVGALQYHVAALLALVGELAGPVEAGTSTPAQIGHAVADLPAELPSPSPGLWAEVDRWADLPVPGAARYPLMRAEMDRWAARRAGLRPRLSVVG